MDKEQDLKCSKADIRNILPQYELNICLTEGDKENEKENICLPITRSQSKAIGAEVPSIYPLVGGFQKA